jgi:hypothetical protein
MSTKGIPHGPHEYHTAQPFADPRNITVGATRVIWAPATGPHIEGRVLAGGMRTQDRGRAMAYAIKVEALANEVATV